MASAGGKVSVLSWIVPAAVPAAVAALGYGAWTAYTTGAIRTFFTGEGCIIRILGLVSALLNLKCLPLAWTVRVLSAVVYHYSLRPPPVLGPRALFAPIITTSRSPLLEIDYNLHKSNATYFSDLDVSRSHLVSYLCRPALRSLADNARTGLVLDPATGRPAPGSLVIALGAVQCSFRREVAVYARFEIWSRVLAWDRKWLYIASHFVSPGTARPVAWLDPRFDGAAGLRRPGAEAPPPEEWEKKMHASAVSKYVFKLGRYTVHPAIVLGASGLLPERPGGWQGGPNGVGDEGELAADGGDGGVLDGAMEGPGGQDWDWKRVELMRRRGLELGSHLAALDGLQQMFDGGDGGALGVF